MMIKEAIEKILSLAPPALVLDNQYSTTKLFPVLDPEVKPLQVHTLTAVVDYLNKIHEDEQGLTGVFVRVVSPDTVVVESTLSGFHRQRTTYLRSCPANEIYPFDRYIPQKEFIVRIQANFIQDEETAAIMAVVGNVVDQNAIQVQDDGVTQQVTAKTGIARVSNINIPNPVTLAPYRTFQEIEQVRSKFIFRMDRSDKGIICALFDADGGMWRVHAILNIHKWLSKNLPNVHILS